MPPESYVTTCRYENGTCQFCFRASDTILIDEKIAKCWDLGWCHFEPCAITIFTWPALTSADLRIQVDELLQNRRVTDEGHAILCATIDPTAQPLIIVDACAGSGKTTVGASSCKIFGPRRSLMIFFNKDAAADAKKRFGINAVTVNAIGNRICTTIIKPVRRSPCV